MTGIGRYTFEIVRRLSQVEGIELVLFSPSPLLEFVKSELISSSIVEGRYRGDISRFVWGETVLPVLLAKHSLDVYWNPAHRVPLFAPRSIATVVTIHDLVWYQHPETMRPLLRWAERFQMPHAIKVADHLIAVSEFTRVSLMEVFSVEPERCTTILHGVSSLESGSSHLVERLPTKWDDYLLFVGTIEPRKNLARILEAIHQVVVNSEIDINLIIVGGAGWGRVELNRLITEFELEGRVAVLGYVSDDELVSLYEGATGLLMPSIYEGFGLPILEAMNRGVPVITSEESAMSEVVSNAGLLVDPLSTQSISGAILKLVTDEHLRARMIEQGFIRAKDFDWDEAAAQLVDCFLHAMESHSRRFL